MALPPEILRAYDIRGTFGSTLSQEIAYEIGQKFAAYLQSHNLQSVAVCQDGRLSSPVLSTALINGLRSQGCNITHIGVGPTPLLYFAVHHLKADAGIMVTGSHNPPQDNGFKITLSDRPFFGDDIQKLPDVKIKDETSLGNLISKDLSKEYCETLLSQIEFGPSPLKIVFDCGNGATGDFLKTLCKKLPSHFETKIIYGEIDGTFPNHHPDPSKIENLKDLIQITHNSLIDVGIAFDGDGDRIGAIDHKGRLLLGDQLSLFFAQGVLQKHPGATVLADIQSSQVFFNMVEKHGGKALMVPTGHSNIKTHMKKVKAVFAGELSGHMFFADRYFGYDDAIYAALRLIESLSQGIKLDTFLDELPPVFTSPSLHIPCNDHLKFIRISELKNQLQREGISFCDIDGVKVYTEDGWWLLRASNTQAILTARFESKTQEGLQRLKEHFEQYFSLK